MGLVDPLISIAFDLEIMAALEEDRRREQSERDNQQAEILAAATGVALTNQALGTQEY